MRKRHTNENSNRTFIGEFVQPMQASIAHQAPTSHNNHNEDNELDVTKGKGIKNATADGHNNCIIENVNNADADSKGNHGSEFEFGSCDESSMDEQESRTAANFANSSGKKHAKEMEEKKVTESKVKNEASKMWKGICFVPMVAIQSAQYT